MNRIRIRVLVFWVLLIGGVGLLSINVVGLGLTYTHKDKLPTPLDYEAALGLVDEARDLADPYEKVVMVNKAVAMSISKQWKDQSTYRVPFFKNYVLFVLPIFEPLFALVGFADLQYEPYEYPNHYDALERGVGICSGYALTVAGFLNEMGIHTSILSMEGHVVAMADMPDKNQIILDANYDVVLPFGMTYAQRNPQHVYEVYVEGGHDAHSADVVARIFAQPVYHVFPQGAKTYSRHLIVVERVAYVVKWLFPVLLVVFAYRLRKKMPST